MGSSRDRSLASSAFRLRDERGKCQREKGVARADSTCPELFVRTLDDFVKPSMYGVITTPFRACSQSLFIAGELMRHDGRFSTIEALHLPSRSS
jgi:hypothetical protein